MKQAMLFIAILITNLSIAQQWNLIYSNEGQTLNDIQFVTDDLGYILGFDSSAFVMKTIDGGANWQRMPIPNSYALKLYFLNENLGYVITSGTPNKLYRTTNGGINWGIHPLDSAYFVTGLAFKNETDGFYLNNEGRLRSIANSGSTYSYISNNFPGDGEIVFTNEMNGYIGSSLGLNKTINGGETWEFIEMDNYPEYNGVFAFSNTNIGYMTRRGELQYQGKIMKTIDGGFNWEEKAMYEAQSIAAVDDFCLAVRDSGNMVWSADGGETWTEEYLNSLYYGSESYTCALSPSKQAYLIDGYPGRIYKRNGEISLLNENNNELIFDVYPNPGNDELFFSKALAERGKKLSIAFINALGQITLVHPYDYLKNSVSIKNLAKGIYTMQVFEEGQLIGNKKFMKN
jgi:photosystem II stability/assembly factor-like uncharacterized protein